MTRFRLTALVAAAVALAPTTMLRGDGNDAMPSTISRSTFDRPYPQFVAASAALDETGTPRRDYFGGETLAAVEGLLAHEMPTDDGACLQYPAVLEAVARGADRSSLKRSLASSPIVFLADVTGTVAGFEYGLPGELIRLEIDRVFKGDVAAGTYYYFVPVARFRFAHLEVCKVDDRFPEAPSVGDRVLMLLAEGEACNEAYIQSHDALEGSQIVTIQKSGPVRSGREIAVDLPALDGPGFEAWVEGVVERSERRAISASAHSVLRSCAAP